MKDFVRLTIIVVVSLISASFFLPASYQVKRSIEITASSSEIFEEIADLKNWSNWSPWLSSNQDFQLSFSDETTDIGSFAEWNGRSDEHGRHVISDIETNRSLKVELEFSKPYPRKAKSQFLIQDLSQTQTQLTWIYYGKNETLFEKIMFLVFQTKSSVQNKYAAALSNIKTIVESKSELDAENAIEAN